MSRARSAAKSISDAGGVMSHRQILFVIFGLMAGMFLSALDQTVVGTSMRTIADDLNGQALQAWVTTAYLIVSTISTPIYGKLSDIFGRRPLFLIAITIFLVGSILSGLATSMYELAVFRALQGLGAGGLMALPLTIMGDILAPRERAKYQGYFLAVFGVSSVIGPVIGGLFAGTSEILFITGWRWVFLINVPLGILALAVVVRFLHVPQSKKASVRIDWWGAALVIIAAVPLLLIAEEGRAWGWGSPAAIACYAVGAIGTAAFIYAEKLMGDDALIPLKLFQSATFSMVTVLGVLVGFGMFGAMMTIPLYLQLVNGADPTQAGFLMLPLILGLMISSIGSGLILARTGKYKIFPIVGTGLMAAGFFYFTFASADKPVWFMMGGMLMVGLGLGQLMQTLTIASQNAVGARDIGVATSSSTFFRQIGGTAGTAVLFSVLFTRIPDTIKDAFKDPTLLRTMKAALADPKVLADPGNKAILNLLQNPKGMGSALNGDTTFLTSADPRLAEPFLTGFASASVTVFFVSLAIVLLAFLLSFFLKATPLRTKSAAQEVAEQDAASQARRAADFAGALIEPVHCSDSRPAADEPDLRSAVSALLEAGLNLEAVPQRIAPGEQVQEREEQPQAHPLPLVHGLMLQNVVRHILRGEVTAAHARAAAAERPFRHPPEDDETAVPFDAARAQDEAPGESDRGRVQVARAADRGVEDKILERIHPATLAVQSKPSALTQPKECPVRGYRQQKPRRDDRRNGAGVGDEKMTLAGHCIEVGCRECERRNSHARNRQPWHGRAPPVRAVGSVNRRQLCQNHTGNAPPERHDEQCGDHIARSVPLIDKSGRACNDRERGTKNRDDRPQSTTRDQEDQEGRGCRHRGVTGRQGVLQVAAHSQVFSAENCRLQNLGAHSGREGNACTDDQHRPVATDGRDNQGGDEPEDDREHGNNVQIAQHEWRDALLPDGRPRVGALIDHLPDVRANEEQVDGGEDRGHDDEAANEGGHSHPWIATHSL